MNSIVFTHFDAPAPGVSSLDIALDRLGAWLDSEIGSIEDLLYISGHEDAIADIVALRGLHLEATSTPEDTRRLLEDAKVSLERLLERVWTIPSVGPFTRPTPSDFDAWLRWTGARLDDILATLRHSLAA